MIFGHAYSAQNTVNQWLKNLAGEQGNLELDAEGKCYLLSQQGITMMISCGKDDRQLLLLSELLNIPIPFSSRLYEELLALNLNVDFNLGAQIYFDKNSRILGLLFSRDIDTINEISFINLLGNFQKKVLEMKDLIDALVFGSLANHDIEKLNHRTKNPVVDNSWRSA